MSYFWTYFCVIWNNALKHWRYKYYIYITRIKVSICRIQVNFVAYAIYFKIQPSVTGGCLFKRHNYTWTTLITLDIHGRLKGCKKLVQNGKDILQQKVIPLFVARSRLLFYVTLIKRSRNIFISTFSTIWYSQR